MCVRERKRRRRRRRVYWQEVEERRSRRRQKKAWRVGGGGNFIDLSTTNDRREVRTTRFDQKSNVHDSAPLCCAVCSQI
jgi:hypothetical protein